MNGKQIILIILCIFASGFLIWFFRCLKAAQDEIKAIIDQKFSGKRIIKRDRLALHIAQQSCGYSQSRGNGDLILTDDELFFAMPCPKKIITVPLRLIGKIERTMRMGGKSIMKEMLKVNFRTDTGEEDAIAFYVKELDAWESALKEKKAS